MITFIIQLLVSIIGGFAAGLQASFTGLMGQRVGELGSVAITYCGGALVIAVITILSGGGGLSAWRTIPWYAYLAGPLGLVIIGSLSYRVPRLGATAATTLFVVSWLFISVLIDQFGWLGVPVKTIEFGRIIGIIALLGGTFLVIR